MHEDLLGYILGALEPHEMRRVDQWIQEDPEARRMLAEIQRKLRPLEQMPPVELPPSDRIARTMASLPPMPAPPPGNADESATSAVGASENAIEPAPLAPMQVHIEPPSQNGWSWMDWAAGSAAAAILLALLLPAIAEGRFEARKSSCQDQLRHFGTAITQFVSRSEQSRLPAVSNSGPEAFAGVYAVRLHEAGLLDDDSIRWCPSLDSPNVDSPANMLVPIERLHQASPNELRSIQQNAGGHYAYTLGVIEKEALKPPRFESRSSFAVMSDAPQTRTASDATVDQSAGHSGVGINVLFEDGRVQFIPLASLNSIPDHPLRNHRGDVEAGVDVDDASLAPSWRPPFVDVRQR
ncbi:hypothetical protein K227x_12640 [Rubripirellula lacrimiformis]|uniref:Uncharacterized protein n=1 Tax=Rubripirellula lacrimiformis TaxID=1930273 RepID=A0A517N6Y5_9BACT|nr:hypothetical protein [Rubripirellula lacrimiformis]QDT02885.1 hypothetical protein K227x_12640 [Rubripirellula lacrimiformis]